MRNAIWWLLFLVVGVWAQFFVVGVDFLVVGLIASLQEGRPRQTLWLALAFGLVQEGAGSLAFGSAVLWYGALVVCFYVGVWLFDAYSVRFVCLLAAVMGMWHYVLVHAMAGLQDDVVDSKLLAEESVLQAIAIPLAWFFVRKLRIRKQTERAPDVMAF